MCQNLSALANNLCCKNQGAILFRNIKHELNVITSNDDINLIYKYAFDSKDFISNNYFPTAWVWYPIALKYCGIKVKFVSNPFGSWSLRYECYNEKK